MSELTVYLAGPVAHKADGGASWRNAITETYSDAPIDFRNPLSKYKVPATDVEIVSDDPGENEVTPADIVHADKELLRESDAVLVGYSAVRSIGTPMEVMWAYNRYKPVALWIRDGTPEENLSPWYRHHVSGIYDEMSDAVGALQDAADERSP